MGRFVSDLARGAVAGLAGTAAMTVAIAIGHAGKPTRTPAPAEITSNVELKVGVRERFSLPAFTASWLAAHFAYGMGWGAGYALLRPLLPRSTAIAGLLYGGGLWALSYLGLMPALGLYPRPKEDYPSRVATMIAAHALYGVTTSETQRRL